VYVAYGTVPAVAAVLWGLKPAVIAVVAAAVVRLWGRAVRTGAAAALAVGALACMLGGAPFPWIVLGAAIAGWLVGQTWPGALQTAAHGGPAAESATWDQGSGSLAASRRPSRSRLVQCLLAAAVLWGLPMAGLAWACGWEGALARMGLFFTQAALVTFGGAYAVLPYVRDHAIAAGWLRPGQMLDGLALGETTPGPLIMVVAFVGFVGGAQAAGLGWWGAVLGCLVATYFTFLPSLVLVLAGAPWFERTRGQVRLASALSGITAAVVGVVFHLALTLGLQVMLLPAGTDWLAQWARAAAGRGPGSAPAGVDGWALVLAAAAWVCLVRWRVGVVPVVLGCGLAGLLSWLV
jgi:chromate transporter